MLNSFGTGNEVLPNGTTRLACDILGRRIANGDYQPGKTMPVEPDLALSLRVSRTTVRDAVKVLAGKGMLKTARRYGTKVRPVAEWNLLDTDVIAWHSPSHPRMTALFAETTELRSIVEPAAAALAAERASPEQVALITAAAETLHDPASTFAERLEADCRFHMAVLNATANMAICQLAPLVNKMLRLSYEFGVPGHKDDWIPTRGHIDVANAIAAGNADAARVAMTAMFEHNKGVVQHFIER